MTWIKPSFRWMLYRSGCGTKPGQERVLAITLTRAGFDDALGMACLSHYEPDVHASHDAWKAQLAASPVRIQWDPERGPALEALPWRAIQVGLSGPAVASYLSSWIVGIEDVTPAAHAADVAMTSGGAVPEAREERAYPVPAAVRARLGMQPDG